MEGALLGDKALLGKLGAVQAATIITPSLDAIRDSWVRLLRYREIATFTLPQDAAIAWQAPVAAGSSCMSIAPPNGSGPILRFVERPAVTGFRALATLGWNALEILVQEPDGLVDLLAGSGFRHLSGPANLQGMADIRAVQFADPSNVAVYFTRIGDEAATSGLPQAQTPIDRLFITILGTSSLSATRKFYAQYFGMETSTPHPARISGLSKSNGLDPETQHELCVAKLAPGHLLEIDQFPSMVQRREVPTNDLPSGLISLAFTWEAGNKQGPTYGPLPDLPGRLMRYIIGLDGEGLELVS